MGDRTFVSKEQWPPSSSTADRRRLHVHLPGAPEHLQVQKQPTMEQPRAEFFSSLNSQRQHARPSSGATSNSRIMEHSPSWSAPKATDTALLSKPRAYRKRVRAEDLWDRDEEELLQRRARELASAHALAGAGAGEKPQRSQPECVDPSGMGQDVHGFGGAGDELLHSDPVEGREQVYIRSESDALNYVEDKIPSGVPENRSHQQAYTQVKSDTFNSTEDSIASRSLESQSHQQAYTQPEVDALQYADHNIPSRSRESQSHLDLKRPRDRYVDDLSARDDAELEPLKRRRNKAGYTQPSTMVNGLPHKEPQDALIDVLLKKLADEQGKTRAVKQELKRLKHHQGAAEKAKKQTKQNKGKKKAAATQKGKEKSGQTHQTTLSANIPSARKAPGDSGHVEQRRADRVGRTYETLLSADTPFPRKEPGDTYHVGKHREAGQAGRTHEKLLSGDTPSLKEERNDTGRLATFTKFESLPDNVQDVIFGILLESCDPINLNIVIPKTFVRNKVGIPCATSSGKKKRKNRPRMLQLKSLHELRLELDNMKAGLDKISPGEWPSDSVAGGLTLSILFVSKAVHRKAARCFYGNNVFEFSDARDAWLHLELFLTTIGPGNASNLQHLSVAMPKWFPNTSNDAVAGALLDALSPVTRLANFNNVAEDPLLSAISSCTSTLAHHGGLKSFQINIMLCNLGFFLDCHHGDAAYNLSAEEKDNKAKRRNEGFQLLCDLGGALGPGCKPQLLIHTTKNDIKGGTGFYSQLPSIQLEAEKYGWDLNSALLEIRDKLNTSK